MASRMSKPLLFSKAPPAGILFEHATRMGNGGIRVAMQYDLAHAPEMDLGTGKQAKVLIQTAKLRRATPVYSEKFKKWTCLCSMGGYQDEFGEIAGFYSWVKDMDTHVIGTCKERCQEWFKKSLTAAQVEGKCDDALKHMGSQCCSHHSICCVQITTPPPSRLMKRTSTLPLCASTFLSATGPLR